MALGLPGPFLLKMILNKENNYMKALVLFSGGLDSSVCLAMAVKKHGADQVMALSIFSVGLACWTTFTSYH